MGAVEPEVACTSAVNVTLWPNTEGLTEEATVVEVPTLTLVNVTVAVCVMVVLSVVSFAV